MDLSDVFTSVAYKELVQVDLPEGSHQHEINGISQLRNFFSQPVHNIPIQWFYFSDDQDTAKEFGFITFYDARARSAARTGRTEWRLYYTGEFLKLAEAGDILILTKTSDEKIFGLIFEKNSGWLRAAKILFGLDQVGNRSFEIISNIALQEKELQFVRQNILSELELEVVLPVIRSDREIILEAFGNQFPTTQTMSEFARQLVDVDLTDADETLITWLQREEELFRALEENIVGERLQKNFSSVEEFISYSLSVQNRRKSRMGHALENHLAALFDAKGVRYDKQAKTEGKNKPDFIFPGYDEYHDADFDQQLLDMLGSKSSCKDRWRQVLTEAGRIPRKYLCTLETGISSNQTDEMRTQNLTLVIPKPLHSTYTPDQQTEILTVNEFIKLIKAKQA